VYFSILCHKASSAAVERVFSEGGLLTET